jgi:hypothetical protein
LVLLGGIGCPAHHSYWIVVCHTDLSIILIILSIIQLSIKLWLTENQLFDWT